jgi:hypothetical protein
MVHSYATVAVEKEPCPAVLLAALQRCNHQGEQGGQAVAQEEAVTNNNVFWRRRAVCKPLLTACMYFSSGWEVMFWGVLIASAGTTY